MLHPTVDDVPVPEVWYCAECGTATQTVIARLLGGWADVICLYTGKPATGAPKPPMDPAGHVPAEKRKKHKR